MLNFALQHLLGTVRPSENRQKATVRVEASGWHRSDRMHVSNYPNLLASCACDRHCPLR